MRSAATVVAARIAWIGRHAPLDEHVELLGVAAVPDGRGVGAEGDLHAGLDRLRQRLLRLREHLGRLGLERLAAGSEMSQFSVSAQVDTRKVPVSTIRWMVSSLIIIPCSMQSMPASIAALTAVSPWAWVATRRPRRWASSAIAGQLLGGVLLRARRTGRRHHAARGAALDELGAVLDLVADGLADLVDPVGDALLDRHRHDARRQAALRARVEVAAGRADGVAGGDDAAAPRPSRRRWPRRARRRPGSRRS